MELRNYQQQAYQGVMDALNDHDSTLLVMATGTGKTIVFSHVAQDFMPEGRVMMLAHRAELIYQGANHLGNICGSVPEIEMGAEFSGYGWGDTDIVVSTVQTQIAGMNGKGRMTRFDPDDFSLLIIDEAHHGAAASYRRVIDYYRQNPKLKVMGVTATPDRADELALGQIFESVAYEYGILDAVNDGYLVEPRPFMIEIDGLDFSGCRTTAGDLNGRDLAKVMEQEAELHEMVSTIVQESGSLQTLTFCASLAHAEKFAEILNRHRLGSAHWVHGGTKKDVRANMFKAYSENAYQHLVNVGVATEGYDEPQVKIIPLCRPTKSRSLYAQMIGRGTRVLPGTIDGIDHIESRKCAIANSMKPYLNVLDFVGNAGRHRLVSVADILGGEENDDVLDRVNSNARKKREPVSVLEEMRIAREQLEAEAVSADAKLRRARVIGRAKYSKAKVNPFTVLDIEPVREKGWNVGRAPSEKQIECLNRMGVDPVGLSHTHASQVIGRLIKNRKEKLCTYKQAKVLSRYHYDAKDFTFGQASELIDRIAQNGWRRPA